MFLVFTFPDCGDLAAESIVPLKLHGQWIRSRGWNNPIRVVFMTGFDTLSEGYKQDLVNMGYELTDMGSLTRMIVEKYPKSKSMPPYFRYTFLRWLLLLEMLEGELVTLPAVTIGGDVIFTSDPEAIYEEIKDKTFVLQGCPDFVSIANRAWLEIYRNEFLQYLSSPNDYHNYKHFDPAEARDDRSYCNVSCYKLPLRHDQDLIEFLVHFSILPQETTASAFADSKYYWMQNPLLPVQWQAEQIGSAPFYAQEKDSRFFIANKLVPFIHLQNDYTRCSLAWMGLKKFGLDFATGSILADYITGVPSFRSKVVRKIGTLAMEGRSRMSRRDIAQLLFSKNPRTGGYFFLEVLNSFASIHGTDR